MHFKPKRRADKVQLPAMIQGLGATCAVCVPGDGNLIRSCTALILDGFFLIALYKAEGSEPREARRLLGRFADNLKVTCEKDEVGELEAGQARD